MAPSSRLTPPSGIKVEEVPFYVVKCLTAEFLGCSPRDMSDADSDSFGTRSFVQEETVSMPPTCALGGNMVTRRGGWPILGSDASWCFGCLDITI